MNWQLSDYNGIIVALFKKGWKLPALYALCALTAKVRLPEVVSDLRRSARGNYGQSPLA
jgi:hypothetical protein